MEARGTALDLAVVAAPARSKFPFEQVPRLARPHSPLGPSRSRPFLRGCKARAPASFFFLFLFFKKEKKLCPLWTRTVGGGGSCVTDATGAGSVWHAVGNKLDWRCRGRQWLTRRALFFLHNELDGGEKRPLEKRKRREKNPTHIKAVDSCGEMSEGERDPTRQMRTHCHLCLMRCVRAASVESTAGARTDTSRGLRLNPLNLVWIWMTQVIKPPQDYWCKSGIVFSQKAKLRSQFLDGMQREWGRNSSSNAACETFIHRNSSQQRRNTREAHF